MIKEEYPLVSCIMPTANRQKFVLFAIQYFLRQDYPNKELVIVDDGTESIEPLVPNAAGIKYVRLQNLMNTIGEKRNYACAITKGEIIAHWDDDDWYAPDWIRNGVNTLLETGSDIFGLKEIIFYSPEMKKCWKYIYPPAERQWVCGATMMYRKELWLRHPFKNLRIGEDNTFVWDSKAGIFAHSFMKGFVAIIHPDNTSKKNTATNRWIPISTQDLPNMMNSDLVNYG